MKKCENRISAAPLELPERPAPLLSGGCGGFDRAVLGRDLLPRVRPLQPFDHHAVGLGEAGANHAQAVDHGAEFDALGADRPVGGHGEDDLVRLVRCDRIVGYQERRVLTAEQPQTAKETWRQQPILVVEHGAAADRAGLGIHHVVDEIHLAVVIVVALVREPYRNRVLHVA